MLITVTKHTISFRMQNRQSLARHKPFTNHLSVVSLSPSHTRTRTYTNFSNAHTEWTELSRICTPRPSLVFLWPFTLTGLTSYQEMWMYGGFFCPCPPLQSGVCLIWLTSLFLQTGEEAQLINQDLWRRKALNRVLRFISASLVGDWQLHNHTFSLSLFFTHQSVPSQIVFASAKRKTRGG